MLRIELASGACVLSYHFIDGDTSNLTCQSSCDAFSNILDATLVPYEIQPIFKAFEAILQGNEFLTVAFLATALGKIAFHAFAIG